jgi:pimeloyl-ACP methyl ester carboxylesterase
MHWIAVNSADPAQTLILKGGRTLGYAEWGNASGVPLVHLHGSSSSRLEHPLQPEALEGVRLVTIDRPGHGLSDFQPGRTLLDWPQDVEALADHLGIEEFAVSGWSAGGPYALACAYRIPERLTRVGLISSFGPYDRPAATADMDRFNKIALAMARRMPWALTRRLTQMMGRTFTRDPEGTAQRRFASLPDPDRQALSEPSARDMLLASMVESFRAGSDGSAWEARLMTLPWGFDLRDIAVPVALWHGDADINSPLAAANYLSHTIPNASLTVFPDEGHFHILKHWGEMIGQLTDAPDQ